MSNIHSVILELCDERGIKPTKMSKDIGLSRSFMTELKSGRTKKPSAETIQKIASYFGVTTDYLLGSPGEADPRDIPPEPELTDEQLLTAFWGKNPHNMTTDDVRRLKDLAKIMELDRAKSSNSEKGGQH